MNGKHIIVQIIIGLERRSKQCTGESPCVLTLAAEERLELLHSTTTIGRKEAQQMLLFVECGTSSRFWSVGFAGPVGWGRSHTTRSTHSVVAALMHAAEAYMRCMFGVEQYTTCTTTGCSCLSPTPEKLVVHIMTIMPEVVRHSSRLLLD